LKDKTLGLGLYGWRLYHPTPSLPVKQLPDATWPCSVSPSAASEHLCINSWTRWIISSVHTTSSIL